MSAAPSQKVTRKLVSGREIFICDNFFADETAVRVGQLLKTLTYRRGEASRPGLPISGDVCEIVEPLLSGEPFFAALRRAGEQMFPNERFERERLYVNNAVYGDVYFPHRDCAPDARNVTVLYYGNLGWHTDWGGETVFYNDEQEAELAITPRPGRMVISRGAILHRGGMPSRVCYEERLTIAYKLRAVG